MGSSRDVSFGPTSPYRGWRLQLDQRTDGGSVLAQVETSPRSVNGRMHCAMVLPLGSPAWTAAVDGIEAGWGVPLEGIMTAILANMPEQAAAWKATPLQQAHIGLISAAGVHARREWEQRYPHGVPAYEVIGAGVYDPTTDAVTYAVHDRPTATAVLPRRNPHPHNADGTTDDFYG